MAPAPEGTDDVRYDIALTRQRMTVTLEELSREMQARKAEARAKTVGRVEDFVQEHPLVTAAIAFGAGVLLAGTGADEKAAKGVVKGAKATPAALAGAAKAVPGAAKSLAVKVKDRVSGNGADAEKSDSTVTASGSHALHLTATDGTAPLGEPTVTHARAVASDGTLDRVAGGLSGLLRKALSPVLDEMERAARELSADLARGSRPPASRAVPHLAFDAGTDVPRDGAVPPSTYGLAESASTGRPPVASTLSSASAARTT